MSDQSDRSIRASEYVLGLLEGTDRDRAEAAMRDDPLFRHAVEEFSAKMGALDRAARPEPVPAGMWERIASQIAGMGQDVSDDKRIVSIPRPKTPVAHWRPLALAASLLIGIGLGYVGGYLTVRSPAPVVLVVLQTPENTPGAVFEAFADNSVRILPLQDFPVPEGKIMQVWTLYDPAVGPVSLGTLSSTEISMLEKHNFPIPKTGQLYEITLEPAPSSPSGKPTGPILVKGFAQQQGI